MIIKPIQLLVGLGNPGPEYDGTRHNAGADFINTFANNYYLTLKKEGKFQGFYARLQQNNIDCHLLIPTTYMNNSGEAVRALSHFYKIPPDCIIVAHDELDLPPGTIKFRSGGGHGGHNGLRDIISHLGTKDFHRIRIGIGHPGNKADVTNYVLKKALAQDQALIDDACDDALRFLPQFLSGDIQNATQALHSQHREVGIDGI